MCGFICIINDKNQVFNSNWENLNYFIKHRGPDSQKSHYIKETNSSFFFSRLSILDLSENANQPMISNDDRYVMCFNGEIYNFEDLKKTLNDHGNLITSSSDSKIIFEYFIEFGIEKLISDIKGMYAIVLYDKLKNKVFLHRDFFGKKPLYYILEKDCLIVGSELNIPLLKKFNLFDKRNLNIETFLEYGFFPSNELNFIKNVNEINNGQCIEISFDNKKSDIKEIRSQTNFLKFEKEYNKNKKNFCFENEIEKATQKRLVSDKPIGVFLSSGVDSTIISNVLEKILNYKINVFTIGLEDKNFDETKFHNKNINKKFNYNKYIVTLDEIFEEVNSTFANYPISDPSFYLMSILSRHAKNKVDVILTGDGGDELFSGYNRYKLLDIVALLNKFLPHYGILSKISNKLVQNKIIKDLIINFFFSQDGYDKIIKIIRALDGKNNFEAYKNILSFDVPKKFDLYFNRKNLNSKFENFKVKKLFQLLDLDIYLKNNILFKVDRASMYHGLEIRSPFLDEKIFKNFFYDIRNKKNKIILKNYLTKNKILSKGFNNKYGFSFSVKRYIDKFKFDFIFELENSSNIFNNEQKKFFRNCYNNYIDGDKKLSNFVWKFYILNKFLRKNEI